MTTRGEWRHDVNDVEGMECRVREDADVQLSTRDSDLVGSGDGPGTVEGLALTFNDEYRVHDFVERIEPGAINDQTSLDDVRVLLNHDPSNVLARTASNTAKVEKTTEGLQYEATLPDTDVGNRTATAIRRGDIDASSFGFQVAPDGEEWMRKAGGEELRVITQIEAIHDVSPVVFPANAATSSAVRDILRAETAKRSRQAWRDAGCPPGFCGIDGGGCQPARRSSRSGSKSWVERRQDRHRSARHEAAHAVVAHAKGIEIDEVSVDTGQGYCYLPEGHADPTVALASAGIHQEPSEADRSVARKRIREDLESRNCRRWSERDIASKQAAKMRTARKEAKDILSKHYSAWKSLASTLARRGRMDGDEVRDFLNRQQSFTGSAHRFLDHQRV